MYIAAPKEKNTVALKVSPKGHLICHVSILSPQVSTISPLAAQVAIFSCQGQSSGSSIPLKWLPQNYMHIYITASVLEYHASPITQIDSFSAAKTRILS